MRDAYNNVRTKASLTPAARTATANGTAVDRNDNGAMYQNAVIVITSGVITDGTHTFAVQESDDNSTWSAVADTDLQGTEPVLDTTAADDNAVFELGYLGTKRYLRVAVTVAGATTGGLYGALVLLADPRVAPVVHS